MGPEANKLTTLLDGKALVAGPVDAMREAGIKSVHVVTGYEADAVRAALAGRDCKFIHHVGWAVGMGSSLSAGIRGLLASDDPVGLLVSVGDLPGLHPEWLGALCETFLASDAADCICVPTCRGRFGHPVLFGAAHFPALAGLTGDRGGQSILRAHPECLREVLVDDDAILRDLDTPADFEAWRS